MIRDASFHCGCDAQGLVHAAEVVVHVVKRERPLMILDFLAESHSSAE